MEEDFRARIKARYIKKKLDKIADNTEDTEQSIKDPLKRAKAVIKHFGTHNRLK